MEDQASRLRSVIGKLDSYDLSPMKTSNRMEIITVTSGKGGVGKSSFTVNFAISLAKKGKRVVILDADFGLSNVDLLCGVKSKYDIRYVISGQMKIEDIIIKTFNGVKIISGGSGINELLHMSSIELNIILKQLSELENYADILIIDTGAGINDSIIKLIDASDETLLVLTPEPTSIMDAFAMMKAITRKNNKHIVRLVINRVESPGEAITTKNNFSKVVEKYLGYKVYFLGSIGFDNAVVSAVKKQKPFIISEPLCRASFDIIKITDEYLRNSYQRPQEQKTGIKGFIKKLIGKSDV